MLSGSSIDIKNISLDPIQKYYLFMSKHKLYYKGNGTFTRDYNQSCFKFMTESEAYQWMIDTYNEIGFELSVMTA